MTVSIASAALSRGDAEATAALFRALGDPARVRIVNLLASSEEPVCVCDLVAELGLAQPTVSHHLGKLVEAGWLRPRDRGNGGFFHIDPTAASRVRSTS